MANIKKVSLASAAAYCTSAVPSASSQYYDNGASAYKMLITYTTREEHNFFPGARVNITGFSVSSSAGPTTVTANFCNATIHSVVGPKTFTIVNDDWPWSTTETYTFSGAGTAYLCNGALSSTDLIYAYPEFDAT